MPESSSTTEPELAEIDSLPHEPIVKAHGTPVSGRLVALVSAILIVVVIAAVAFAFSQGVIANPG